MLIFDQLKKSDPRLRFVAVGVLAGMLTLLAGLWYHQILSARHYAETLKSQSFRTVRVPAIRGKILDRNGEPLAENRPNYKANLYLDELRPTFAQEFDRQVAPLLAAKKAQAAQQSSGFFDSLVAKFKGRSTTPRLTRDERDALNRHVRYLVVSNTVAKIGVQLGTPLGLTEEELQKHHLQKRAMPMTLAANLTHQQIAAFQERAASAPGLDLDIQAMRVYPHALATAHILGFMRRDDSSADDEESYFDYRLQDFRGVVGLEGALDSVLRGRAGVRAMMVNNLGYRQSDEVWSPADPGKNVVLTIDLPLQTAAWQALRAGGANTRGAVVVMDVQNGDLLALVSSPTFDPNGFIPSVTPEEWARLNDERLSPLKNRATQITAYIAPGSIFKIVIGLAALEGGLDPAEPFTVEAHRRRPGYGVIYVGKREIDDPAGPGSYNFRRAFIKSSNAYFVHQGSKAGIDSIRRIAQRLHLGERTRLPLMQDDSGIFPTHEWVIQNRGGWSPGDTANICIGQGDVSVTPVQMAVMISAVVNGGKVFWPRIVDRLEPQEFTGTEAVQTPPAARLRDQLGVSPRTLDIVREAMIADVEDPGGTGTRAAVAGMKIGGKTGTAQVTVGRQVVDNVTWFASFGQHKDRTYAVVVMVQSGISGGSSAAPIAQKVYQAIMNRDQLPARRRPPQLAGGDR